MEKTRSYPGIAQIYSFGDSPCNAAVMSGGYTWHDPSYDK